MAKLNEIAINNLTEGKPFCWYDPVFDPTKKPQNVHSIEEAAERLRRFAPLLVKLFPETEASDGIIESDLSETTTLRNALGVEGTVFVKGDHALPIAGSVKARGGIHEVLCFAEELALEQTLISSISDDYTTLASETARAIFSGYEVVVGSTGNLGVSIGIMSAALGFRAVVHMSTEAKEWKKELLRSHGVTVIEHTSDYSEAVRQGRLESEAASDSYFVDDERSSKLFAGYAVAAQRLKKQFEEREIVIDVDNPLFVYLPAGVGGAPGGIAFGLKHFFGEAVHCFFMEPTQAPCMLIGLAGEQNSVPETVYDYGLSIDTDADGLAVGQASEWVCDTVRGLISGVLTLEDAALYKGLNQLYESESLKVEPSGAAGVIGPQMIESDQGVQYLAQHNLAEKKKNIRHLIWTTGGLFVPDDLFRSYLVA